jgi:hypothetical protein
METALQSKCFVKRDLKDLYSGNHIEFLSAFRSCTIWHWIRSIGRFKGTQVPGCSIIWKLWNLQGFFFLFFFKYWSGPYSPFFIKSESASVVECIYQRLKKFLVFSHLFKLSPFLPKKIISHHIIRIYLRLQ